MAVEKQLIRTITEPTIILDDLVSQDTESGTSSTLGYPETASKPSKQYGGAFPLIQVNNYPFTSEQIISLNMSSSGKLPYVTVEILVRDKSFYSTSFPKDGDLLSIFIRGKVEPLKPIRNDYEITNVYVSSDLGSSENSYDTMRISGSLRIPGFNDVKCFSIKDSSLKTMLRVATDLKLGFATNEISTSDSQVWICPNEKVKNFMENTTLSAWKDENSFFSYFIDHYYYVNFVNVEPLFSEKAELEKAISILRMSHDYGTDSQIHSAITNNVLSNWDEISQTQFYINSYSFINNSSSISISHGYKRYAQYYDALLKENQSFFVDPKTTEGAEKDKQLLKGRPNENFYLSQINTKWMGVQYGKNGENNHPMYNYSRVNNYQNNVHIEKMGLKISIPNCNFNLRRMQTVPVIIMIKEDTVRKIINEPKDEVQQKSLSNSPEAVIEKSALSFEEIPFTIDKTMSGFYVIDSINYIYEKGSFRQECILYRREWPIPPQK